MNKSDLIDVLADATGLHEKTARKGLDALLAAIVLNVSNDEAVTLLGFGTFDQQHKPARTARNPQTGEPIEVAETWVPRFKPGGDFKGAVHAASKARQAMEQREALAVAR